MIVRQLGYALAFAALILAAAAGLRYGVVSGAVDAESARRIMQVLLGLGLAGYGNFMPKKLGRPRRSPEAEARMQAALRVGGWAMTLAGLAYAGLWALAPLALADTGGTIAVASAAATTLGYALWCFAACRGARNASAQR
ncbi:MAG TPA: ammonium transporter [Allosphingosinicella sp.]|nr:ammonium transporter [Allosphingosinicella sp.]